MVERFNRAAQPAAAETSTPPLPEDAQQIRLTENAFQVFRRRYMRRDSLGEPIETPEETFWRVAYHVAKVESLWEQPVMDIARQYYDLLADKRFFPNSPTFTGAGTPLGQLAACFVLPLSDDMGRRGDGIFETLRDAALIQQTGGGNGFSFSRLRPKGAVIKSSSGKATGPVGFLRVYDKAFGEIAQGGCLTPETLVFTQKGTLRLDELVDVRQPGWQEHSLVVATDDGWKSSPRGYNNGVQPILRLHTHAGVTLRGTPNHRVKIMTAEGPQWRRLDELQPGDWVQVKLGAHQGSLQALRRPKRVHGNQVMPSLPPVLDEELAFFIGYLVGDGFVASGESDHRLGVSVAHTSYLMEAMPALMERLFGVAVHRQQKPEDGSVTYVIDNRAVKEFLLLNGLDKKSSREAVVPRLVRMSPPAVVGAFLRGLFEADGSVSHGYPVLTTTSSRLVEEVATLLIGLGCPVRLRTIFPGVDHWGKSAVHQVRIVSDVGLRAWREHIGCDPRSRFAVCMAWESDRQRESSYVLPHAAYWVAPVLTAITLEQVDRRGRSLGRKFRSTRPALRKSLLRFMRGERRFTRSAYETLSARYPEFRQHARPLNDLWFVRVLGVEEAGESLTLDLEVAENHTYLAYGMVTHNTRRGANMAVLRVDHPDIEEFITCKTDENAITNFNISVGITDAFMRAVENDEMWALRFPDVEHPLYRDFSGTLEQAEQAGIPIVTYKQVRARELFEKIVRQAHHNGEPGLLFLDTANRDNPVPHLYPLEATNPCVTGETLVATPEGWRRANSIRVGDQILTVAGVGQVAEVEVNHDMPVYRVRFSDGGMVRATASHQFYVYDPKSGAFAPRRLDRLQIGDEVQVVRPFPLPQGETTMAVAAAAGGGLWVSEPAVSEPREGTTAHILSITPDGIETVYDIYEPESDTWITAGYVSRGCGEQWLGPYENCCLGSVNLAQHATEDGCVDWEKLRQSVELATRFLDDVVEANAYVPAVPQLKEAAHKARRIGLGIMGLGDLMYLAGVRYGSPEAQVFAAQIMEFIRYHAMRTSIELARQRGPFPAIKGSIYDPDALKWQPPQMPDWLQDAPHADWGRPPLDWNAIVQGIREHGIRNAAQATIAPTGTISTVAGVEGYGCEPVFALAYIRHVDDNGKDLQLTYVSPLFLRALEQAGLDEATRERVVAQVLEEGTCQRIAELPEHIRHTFVVAQDITAEEHVRMQAAMQAFVDNSLSKTVNFPAHATPDDVALAYNMAWRLGCKGITVYVTGSRQKVVLETRATAAEKEKATPVEAKEKSEKTLWRETKKPRPRRLRGCTYSINTPLGKAFITVNENGGDQPFEVFINTAKAGSDTAAVSEAIGRLLSYILRLESPVEPRQRLREIVHQLAGIGGGRPLGFGPNRVRSLPDGIAQALQEYLVDSGAEDDHSAEERGNGASHSVVPTAIGDLCPDCGEAALVNEEGCRKCYACGYSEC